MSDALFWGLIGAFFAALMAGMIGYVYGRFYGAGAISGGAIALLIFVVAGTILAKTSAALPPPNTVGPPVAPAGGAFRAPAGGAFRSPDAPAPDAVARGAPVGPAAPPPSIEEMGQSAGEAFGKAAYSASAAVTSAAQAARAAIADVVSPGPDAKQSQGPEADRAAEPAMTESEPATLEGEPVRFEAAPAERAAEPVEAHKPVGIDGPRDGAADDLQRIRGIGPKIEENLNGIGVYHFDQIANWGETEVAWADVFIDGVSGRASREDWSGQARRLLEGGEAEPPEDIDRSDQG